VGRSREGDRCNDGLGFCVGGWIVGWLVAVGVRLVWLSGVAGLRALGVGGGEGCGGLLVRVEKSDGLEGGVWVGRG